MDERRLLLAVALSLLVLTAYSLLFPAAPPPPQPPVPAVADVRERRVEVSGAEFPVAFSNRGARLVSWTLGRYKDARGAPEEMVPAAGAGIRPLDIETGAADVDARLKEALFRASAETVHVAPGAPAALRFEYSDGQIEAEKSLEFEPTGLLTLRG